MSTIARVSVSSDQKSQPDDDMLTKMLNFLRKIPASGIILSAMSGFCLAAASLIVKKAPNVNSVQILVSRAIVQFIFVLPFITYYKLPFFGIPGERLPLFMRGFIGFIYASLMYTSYRFIPLADASTIIFSAPVYVTIIACIFLKETCAVSQVVGVVITITGALLVSRPTFIFPVDIETPIDEKLINWKLINETLISGTPFNQTLIESDPIKDRVIGCSMAFCGAIGSAIVIIMIRKMPQTPSVVVINAYSFITVIGGIVYLTIIENCFPNSFFASGIGFPADPTDYLWLFANGLCGVAGQVTLTVSLKLEEAGIVSLARTFEIVTAFVFQAAFLKNESIVWTSYLGAILIIIAVALIAVKKILDSRRK